MSERAPYSYQWSIGATGSSLIDAPVGTYSVTVKDSTNAATQKAVLNILLVTSTLPAMHTVAVRANFSRKSGHLDVRFF